MAGLMTEKWRVVDFSQFAGEVHAARGALSVRRESGEEITVPVADVAVVLFGVETLFTSGCVDRLLKNDISIVFCDWKGIPTGIASPWSDHSRVGARQISQASLSLPRRKAAWKEVVKAKINGQAQVLDLFASNGGDFLRGIAKKVASGDPTNCEGQAAKYFWNALFGPEGFRRHPGVRDSEFRANSLLDYGYTILRGHAMRAVIAAGLAPALGIFHHGRSNAFNLADDLIEPFRPAIDACVAGMAREEVLEDRAVRAALVKAAGETFGRTGNSIPAEMTALAQRFGQYAEGDIERLQVSYWSPTMALEVENAE